jgi:starch synthase (maltosyl-transferring)
MIDEGRRRVVIEAVEPQIDGGRFPVKRVVGEKILVTADIFADGHDRLAAVLRVRGPNDVEWRELPMTFVENDRWRGEFSVGEIGLYRYTIQGWVDHFATWQHDLIKRHETGQELTLHLLIGAGFVEAAAKKADRRDAKRLSEMAGTLREGTSLKQRVDLALSERLATLMAAHPDRRFATTYARELVVSVDRLRARFSSWYELFPRSWSPTPGRHGTFADCIRIVPDVAAMGFDVLYLPPIHPIGKINRKGKNNAQVAEPDDVGSPWAIGSDEGGHTAIHPQLGTMQDFEALVAAAQQHGMEIALDVAFQCAPDHPYVREHPEWFRWRPDGTVQHAENPPKKYEDILPLNFETENWRELWEELKQVFLFWADHGVRMFRVDNPHTKPFRFWEWVIAECRAKHPDLIFLSEAFTRPKIMYNLAKRGFTQSYTYFTWRNTKAEFTEYLTELTQTKVREFFRPNFWPNTPDILAEHLQHATPPAFVMRLVLAATMSSNYGIYGPAFELCVNTPMPGKEEYQYSEKYEIKQWNWNAPGNLKQVIARVNAIRKQNPALQSMENVRFYPVDSEFMLCYGKHTADRSNIIVVVVNLDPTRTHSAAVRLPIGDFGIAPEESYIVEDLLAGNKYVWRGEVNFVELDPRRSPAHIFRLERQVQQLSSHRG